MKRENHLDKYGTEQLGARLAIPEIENTEETNPVEKQIENIKEDEIPVDWTFNLDGKNCSFAFKGYTIKSRMPKIGDKIAIESRR